jgi:uncharacterized protein (DUF1778 family)
MLEETALHNSSPTIYVLLRKRLTIKLYSSESRLDLAASLRASSTTEFGVSGHLPRAGQASNRLS